MKRQTVKCLGCGRKLKAKASVAQRRGPRCQERYTREIETALNFAAIDLAASYTDRQIDKAVELIEQNAIMPYLWADSGTPTNGIYLTVSSDGQHRYTTGAARCTCKAGRHGRRCYHRAAALVLDAVASVAA